MGYRSSRALRLLVAERTESVLARYANQPMAADAGRSADANEAKFLTSLPGRRGGPLRIDMDRLGRTLFNMRVPGWQSAGALPWLGKGGPTKAIVD